MIRGIKGRTIGKCDMCKTSYYKATWFYNWEALLTDDKLVICSKCAKRESGKSKNFKQLTEKWKEQHGKK